MLSDQPDVPGPRDRLHGRLGDLFLGFFGGRIRRFHIRQQPGHLFFGEAKQFERNVLVLELAQFDPECFFIPPRQFGQLVVGQDVRPLLCFGEVIEHHHRHLIEIQLPRGQHAPMSGDDAGVGIHQDRIVEAELRDARCDLGNLGIGVRPRVPHVRDQLTHRPEFDALGHRRGGHRTASVP